MRILSAIIAVFLGSSLGAAELPMTADSFDRYTLGKTLYYAQNGTAYGVEEYLPNRRVRWSYLNGECQMGRWYPAGDMICFEYEAIDDPQCWRFYERGNGLSATFGADEEASAVYETEQSSEPMLCLGPNVGV